MGIDWPALNERTRSYRALQAVADSGGRVSAVVFCGLRVSLSELAGLFPAEGGATLTIYADSLLLDRPSFDAPGVVVVARSVEVAPGAAAGIAVRRPAAGGMAVAEWLVGEFTGGPLLIAPAAVADQAGAAAAPDTTAAFSVPAGMSPLRAAYHQLDGDGRVDSAVRTDAADLRDLLEPTWALNSLKASLAAATWLVDSDGAAEREAARSMLHWVGACARALATEGSALPADVAELQSQAAALLITIDVAPGVLYVPVLSPRFYGHQVETLLAALARYEGQLTSLEVGGGLEQALAGVGAALGGASQDEAGPLQSQLDGIEQNLGQLRRDVIALSGEVQARQIAADARLDVLKAKIASQRILQTVEAAFTMVADVVKVVAALGGDEKKPGDAFAAAFDALKQAKALSDIAGKGSPDHALLDRALQLMQMQAQVMSAFVQGMALWNRRPEPAAATPSTPLSLAADLADPGTAWDAYIVEAEATLADIKGDIGTGTGAGDAQVAANHYLAALKIVAQYAKALNAKLVVAAAQGAQGTVIRAQLRAAQTTQARWKALQAKADSTAQRLAALKGLLQMRCDSVRRSLFAAWMQYRDAYFYLAFEAPPRVMKPDMGAAGLTAAFASASDWVARLHGDTPQAERIRLPDDDVAVTYRFRIVTAQDVPEAGVDTALLTPRHGRTPVSLTWSLASGDAQMAGVLPDGGQVAVWIKEARFFVEGVKPNAKGNVIAEVSTSGSYQNGFGEAASHAFVTKALVGNYAYRVRGDEVYNPWRIDTEVYSTPTPFTQWRMAFDADGGDPAAAGWLRMELRVAYRRAGTAAAPVGEGTDDERVAP